MVIIENRTGRKDPRRRFVHYWLPVVLYCAAIFIQSSFPSPESVPGWPGSDKLMHVAAYAILGGLFLRAYGTSSRGNRAKHAVRVSILFAACYGISDEMHQYFVPARSADWLDAAADVAGAIAGVMIYRRLTGKRPAQDTIPPVI